MVQVFKSLFRFYIHASIHVALAVISLVKITELYFLLTSNPYLEWFIFFSTVSGYNFVKYFQVAKWQHRGLPRSIKTIQIFSFICFLGMCFFGYHLKINALLLFIPFAVLTFFYSIPFLLKSTKSLRTVSFLKVLIVSVVWSGVTSLIPLFINFDDMLPAHIYHFTQRVLFIIVLMIPFEIRDLPYDKGSLKTLPQVFGIEQTKKIGFVLLLFCVVLEFFITQNYLQRNVFLGVFIVTLFFLMRSSEKQKAFYSSFWVESIPIFWYCALLIIS